MTANTPASRKAKGRRLQQAVRQDLIDRLGIDPGDILSTAMGQSGCDLYLSPAARERFPFAVECKAQERIALPGVVATVHPERGSGGARPPLLVLKQSRREPLAVLRWTDLLSAAPARSPMAKPRRGADGGSGMTYPITCPRCGSHRVSVENFWADYDYTIPIPGRDDRGPAVKGAWFSCWCQDCRAGFEVRATGFEASIESTMPESGRERRRILSIRG